MKRDIKYIIKRIIIGVGIAVILGILKTNHVFAEEPNNLYLNYYAWNLKELTTSPWGNEPNIVYNFDYSNYSFNINNVSSNFYYLLFKDNENYYIISSNTFACSNSSNLDNYSGNITFTSSNITYNNNNDISCSSNDPYFFELRTLSINNLSSSFTNEILNNLDSYSFYNQYYNNDFYYNIFLGNYTNGSTPGAGSLYAYNLLKYFYNNFDLVSTSSNINFYLDDELLTPTIPVGYSEISISNNQAVYFVPKNYNDIQIETIDKVNYIDFNYYYKGNVKEGWFPLQNINDLFINNEIPFISESSYALRDSFFPMYENPDGVGYNYYAYIIINNNVNNSYIRYNSILFDSYIIDDFTTYNEKICYINRDSQQQCQDIDFASSVNNYWLDGFNDNNDGFVGEQGKPTNKLFDLFNALKYPINWLTNLINSNSCQYINLPLPFVGGNVKLVCLSSIFKSVLGNYYNIFLYLITGIYAYRITIMNIDTATDVLNPNDDRLEVVEL